MPGRREVEQDVTDASLVEDRLRGETEKRCDNADSNRMRHAIGLFPGTGARWRSQPISILHPIRFYPTSRASRRRRPRSNISSRNTRRVSYTLFFRGILLPDGD